MGVKLTFLGDITIRTDLPEPRVNPIGSPQVGLVLAVLTLERHHGVTRDALADTIWPDTAPTTWRSALRSLVSRARASLATVLGEGNADLLVARGGRYLLRLPDDVAVDVEVAERDAEAAQGAMAQRHLQSAVRLAEQATTLLRAPFLPDHDSDWVTSRRARLLESLVVVLELISRATAELGDAHAARLAALEAVRRAPLRESAHRCLIAAHAAAGNRAEALRAYQRLRRVLAEELGVDPDSETEAAYLRLLGPASRATHPYHADPTGATFSSSIPLVGRQTEKASLYRSWVRATGGTFQVALVTGEAGVGKTHLVTELARDAATEGGLVLFGRCDQGSSIAYQPFVEMLDALVAATPDDELPALSSEGRSALADVFPACAAWRGSPGRVDLRPVLFDAVARLLVTIAIDRSSLVVVDDLQWADDASILLLKYLLRRIRAARTMLVAIARDDLQPGRRRAAELVHELDPDGRLTFLRLESLDRAAGRMLVGNLVQQPAGSMPAARQLVADTAGNPGLLIDAARAMIGRDPSGTPASDPIWDRLHWRVGTMLGPLPPTARRLLEVGAVSAQPCDLDVVAAASGVSTTDAIDALDAGLKARLCEEVADGDRNLFRFRHEVVRLSIDLQLSQARRRQIQARLSEAHDRLLRGADRERTASH